MHHYAHRRIKYGEVRCVGGFIVLGMLAAFGLVCALWVLIGLLLPRRCGTVIYLGDDAQAAAQRHLWLREMGLTQDRLILLECKDEDRDWLQGQGIEICSLDDLIRRLKMGEKEIDAGA